MFDRIFGRYLADKGCITEEQLQAAIEKQKQVRVKLGVIAVSEKLMTKEQADEVNRLQAVTDRRFGDLAVEKGYLTEEQVSRLLRKQGNIYLYFVQSLIDLDIMTLEEIDGELANYQDDNNMTHSDIDDLLSGDIERVVEVFLPSQEELYGKLCGIAIRTVVRLIDSSAYVKKAYLTDSFATDRLAAQRSHGDHTVWAGFSGKGDNLLSVANSYAEEEFGKVDLDALDSMGEFTNCIDGLFASEMSKENVDIDMCPPDFYDRPVKIKGDYFCVLPVIVFDKEVEFVVSIDSEIKVDFTE